MTPDSFASFVERIIAIGGTGYLVISIIGLMVGWVVPGKTHKAIVSGLVKQLHAMENDRDFFRKQLFETHAALNQELGVDDA